MAELLAPVLRPPLEPVAAPWISATTKGGTVIDRIFGSSEGTMVGVERGYSNAVWIWSQIKDSLFAQLRLDNATLTTRLSWRETIAFNLRKLYPVKDLTFSGSWTQLNTSGSGVLAKHAGDRAAAASTNGAYAQCDVTRSKPYDLYVAYTGRTDGAYCRVDIDGSQALVNEIGDPAALGYKAFSSYNAVNQSVRQYIKVASGLTGTHTVRVTKSAAASPGGNTLQIEAIAIDGDIADDRVMPPVWQPSTAYTIGDEVQLNGIYYSARATATSGSGAGPTHATGIASDGSMDWNASRYTSWQEQVILSPADSEREYAFEATLGGVTADIGGQTHGDETLGTRTITVDNVAWSEGGAFVTITAGAEIKINESLTWTHPNDATLASATFARSYTPGKAKHNLAVTSTADTDIGLGYAYATMQPANSWDDVFRKRGFDQVALDNGAKYNLDDYVNQANPNVNCGAVYGVAAIGTIHGKRVGYGARATRASLKNYENMDAQAFFRPNIFGVDAAGTGVWLFKTYLNRAVTGFKEALPAGASITIENEHAFHLV